MGAYLFFKTESNANEVANYLLEENQLNKKLIELDEQNVYISCDEDIQWAKKERPDLIKMMKRKYSTGDIKTSSGIGEMFEQAGYTYEDLAKMWVTIFEELNKRFKMKYYAHSCSLDLNSSYFTLEQLKKITNNGKLLSGKSSKSEDVVKLYRTYYKIFSELQIKETKEIETISQKLL